MEDDEAQPLHAGGKIDWKPGDPVPDIIGAACCHPRFPKLEPGERIEILVVSSRQTDGDPRAARIADRVVPDYRDPDTGFSAYPAESRTSLRWTAAYDAAVIALSGVSGE